MNTEPNAVNTASVKDHICVQAADFDMAAEYSALISANQADGAVVTFTGLVRDHNQGEQVSGLFLEHYPGMTEKSLQQICDQARQRWHLGRIRIIHRVGQLMLSDQIVFVGVTAKHRQSAFDAASFLMDYLKTQAPFWKKESAESGERWVDARASDQSALGKWRSI